MKKFSLLSVLPACACILCLLLLCAEDADGNLSLMTPEKEMPAGAEIC